MSCLLTVTRATWEKSQTKLKMNNNREMLIAVSSAPTKSSVNTIVANTTTNTSSNNSQLNMSISSNNGDKNKKAHCCPFCDRSFTRPYRLNDHISFSHTEDVI